MSRLASFRGPSTPSSSPVQHKPQTPASPSRQTESTFHRKIRTCLQELRFICETWDDLILMDGLKSAKSLVDARTDLDNALALIPDRVPRTHLVGPKIAIMEKRIVELNTVIYKLERQFRKMNSVIDNMESILSEAEKAKGWKWVADEPLWVTWSLDKFVTRIPDVILPYHRSLAFCKDLTNKLCKHSLPFDDSRMIISQWMGQPWLEDAGWDAQWEELCAAEVERWDK
ncbi:hypothetical protein BDQ17DRAFT_1243811 [Cyathus striatus]|nr:hypothetical protein BDQ17DRAFT_1243811 [Cyathus striatus]